MKILNKLKIYFHFPSQKYGTYIFVFGMYLLTILYVHSIKYNMLKMVIA